MTPDLFTAVLLIIFLAAVIRTTFGFGDAIVAMPLLSIFIPLETATPLVGLAAVVFSLIILYKEWRLVKFKSVLGLIVSSLIGIPVGILLLRGGNDALLKILLGIIIVLFSIYNLSGKTKFRLKGEKFTGFFGLLAGILGGAYNSNGPPVVIYCVLKDWDPKSFRASLQGYFLPTGFLISVGHAVSGLWTKPVMLTFFFVLPAIITGALLGNYISKKINAANFNRLLHIFLIFTGILLVLKNL